MPTKYEEIADGSNIVSASWLGNHLVIIKRDPFARKWIKATYTDITRDQFDAWCCGELIQNAMPHISADDREFLISGITPEPWAKAFDNRGAD